MFGKKKNNDRDEEQAKGTPEATTAAGQGDAPTYDPVTGDFGPFDGDTVDYREFDFSEFAKGGLDLGSLMVPVPHEAEVQVEMGPNGPQMVHIVTPYGRVTPVAFAAPRNDDLWVESVPEVVAGMQKDGLSVDVEEGPWGQEISAVAGDGAMRVIGVTGPRWMLRMTFAGPADRRDEMTKLGRDMVARTFVNRGKDPIPAGSPLPVQIPQAMAQELQRQMQQRANQAQQGGNEN